MKYYKVSLCKVKEDSLRSLNLESCSKDIIVRKSFFGLFAKEILTNAEFEICTVDQWSENKQLCYSGYNLSNYGVDYFIFKNQICDGNIVDAEEVQEYIDNFDENEYEFISFLSRINKGSRKEQRKVKQLIRSHKENK